MAATLKQMHSGKSGDFFPYTHARGVQVDRGSSTVWLQDLIETIIQSADASANSASSVEQSIANLRDMLTQTPTAIPMLCGQPSILFGAGTPQEAIVPDNWKQFADGGFDWNGTPVAAGQQYINTAVSTGGQYIAVQDSNYTLTWHQL